jgi:sugar/nucleoside kinase (ribokinase family)
MIKRALFVGLTTVDIQYFVDRFPDSNTKVKTDAPHVTAGGPAANAAITFSHLGGKVDFLTCIGKNSFQTLLYEDLEKYRVRILDYGKDNAFQPIIASVITTTSNSNRTIFTHHPEELPRIEQVEEINLENYDFVFVDGFYPELSIPVCRKARALGLHVIFDGGSWKDHLSKLLPYIDTAICSNNFQPPKCSSEEDIFACLKLYGVKNIAISRGEKSLLLPADQIEIEEVNAIDSLGAGDVLHGAFCWYRMEDNTFR